MKYEFSTNNDINATLNQVVQCITDMAESQVSHIERLTTIGKSLSSETNLQNIFDMILEEAIEFTNADGATIYEVSEDGKNLVFEIVYTESLGIRMGGKAGPVKWPMIPLYDEQDNPRLSHIVTSVFHSKKSLIFDDVYETQEYDISGMIKTDRDHNYRCKSMLTIPLKNHEDEVLGIIQMINARDKHKSIVPFTPEHTVMMDSLASQAAIALSNRKLIESLESLLMQFMRSIAHGIERKTKYTSDHIVRVANLTDMIAAKINDAPDGKYGTVHFTETELKELSMAGWMHDVGKIITPESIMDKSVKLETIFDRIEVVKLRFEVMSLIMHNIGIDMAIEEFDSFLKTHLSPSVNSSSYQQYLIDELAFLENVNHGTEFLADSDFERIEVLAQIKFDYKGKEYYLINDNEKRNLQIRRGTLLAEEIKLMAEHVSVTWEMLSDITFPKKYKNVAFYASSHHEKLNGKGYPRGLTADEMPLQARIIAVADIYEALTAGDRPYKKAKTLSESLKIMATCVKFGELDGDILDFFLDSGLYMDYANRFMDDKQIDQIDIATLKQIYHIELNA